MRTIIITANASKFTGRVFAKAIAKVREHIKIEKDHQAANERARCHAQGKQSVKGFVA